MREAKFCLDFAGCLNYEIIRGADIQNPRQAFIDEALGSK